MSYCMFENTSRDINQLIEALQQARTKSDLNLNEHEQRAYDMLAGKCEELTSQLEDMEDKPTFNEAEVKDGVDSRTITEDMIDGFDNVTLRIVRDEADRLFTIAVTPGSWNEQKAGYYQDLNGAAVAELEQRHDER